MLKACFRAIAVLCFLPAVLQAGSQPSPRFPRANRCIGEPIQGQPYSAEFKIIALQLLASGEQFTHNFTEREARDAHGRFYHASVVPPPKPGMENHPALVSGHVCDSVADTMTMWNSADRRTIVLQLPPPDKQHGCWKSDTENFTLNFEKAPRKAKDSDSTSAELPATARSEPSPGEPGRATQPVQLLGPTWVQGIEAQGYRSFLAPAQEGQSDPPYLSEEHWAAPSLGIWVMQEVNYPRKLNSTLKWSREPVSIDVSEPDPLLFEPPREYPVTSLQMRQVSCSELQPPVSAQSPHLQ